ncbi:MAG: tetratricopeptide repeat protein, partial [Luminiphilus sp.]
MKPDPPQPPAEMPIPEDSLYPLLKAEFLLRERQFDPALAILTEQALKLDDAALARRALRLAEFRQDDAKSLVLAVRLSELDVGDAAAATTAMGLLIRAGKPEEALVFARTAKERGARINAPALLVTWDSLPPDKRRAVASAVEALAEDWPQDQDIAIAVAYLRRAQDDPERALAALEPVLAANPDEERALLLWSQIKLDVGAQQPFSLLQASVDRNPENEALRLQLARLLASAEVLDQAREQFAMLLTLSPRNGDYLFSLALIELEAKDYQAAKRNLQDLIGLGQRLDEAQYYLGRAHENLQEEEQA